MTLVLGNETADFEGKIFVKGQAENPYCSKSFSSLLNSRKPYVFKVVFQHCDVQLLDNVIYFDLTESIFQYSFSSILWRQQWLYKNMQCS